MQIVNIIADTSELTLTYSIDKTSMLKEEWAYSCYRDRVNRWASQYLIPNMIYEAKVLHFPDPLDKIVDG